MPSRLTAVKPLARSNYGSTWFTDFPSLCACKSDQSDWFWFQSIVFTDPFKTRMSLDLARGRDSWCWPKGARPLWTRMSIKRTCSDYVLAKSKQKVSKNPSNFCLKILAAENEWWGGTLWEWILVPGRVRISAEPTSFPGLFPLKLSSKGKALGTRLQRNNGDLTETNNERVGESMPAHM